MVTRTFQRTKPHCYKKLGSRAKIRYKRPTGRHNKSRQKWRSRPPMVEIGYRNKNETRCMINGKMPVLVNNLRELNAVGKDSIAVIGRVGNRTRIELAKEIISKKIEVLNLNVKKFMKETNRQIKIKSKQKTEVKSAEKKEEKNEAKEKVEEAKK